MARSTPRGHTEASREILMCVTGRTSREAVHDSGLIQREGPAHIGCSGDCADQGECNCSHSKAWQAPRQPRLPEPRTPHLPLWTRFTLWRDRPRLTNQQAIEALKRLPANEWAKMAAFFAAINAAGFAIGWILPELWKAVMR